MSFQVRAMAAEDLDRVLVLAGESVEAPRWTRADYERILLAEPRISCSAADWLRLAVRPGWLCRCQLAAAGDWPR